MKLKKSFFAAVVLSLLLSVFALPVAAITVNDVAQCAPLRAGGGSGGGGGGTGGGSTGTHHHTHTNSNGNASPYGGIIGLGLFLLFSSLTGILLRFKLFKYGRNTKKLMKMLEKKDSAWKYKNLQKRVRNAYFLIQKSWTAMDMTPAEGVMSKSLFDEFQTKLAWMEYRRQRNVLKRIRLSEAVPVSVYDDENNELDYVWFYIKGSMADYIINTETNETVSGSTSSEGFAEYWQFTRNSKGDWVLNKILQEDEADKIAFSE